jgi:hypothetical protein
MPKTIEGDEDIEFKPTTAQADSLDDAVTGTQTLGTANAQIITPEVMDKVWDAYVSFVVNCGYGTLPKYRDLLDERHKFAVCSLAQLSYVIPKRNRSANWWRLEFTPTSISYLSLLTGQQGADASIVNSLTKGISGGIAPVEIVNLIFPETLVFTEAVGNIKNTFLTNIKETTMNPYLSVLHAAPKFKGFLGGVIHHAEAQGKYKFDYNSKVYVATAPKPSLADLAEYGAKIGVSDLTPYLTELSKIPIIDTT